MADYLCISIRFLNGSFHGRADGGEPEWPPSPLRLYQAIVAASAARWNERRGLHHADAALRWLETLPAPIITAPRANLAQGYRLYVPDNVGDLVGSSWAEGRANSLANYRTEKLVRPNVFEGEGIVYYYWNRADMRQGFAQHCETLFEAVHAITHVGWGVDLAVGHAFEMSDDTAETLPGQRWLPVKQAGSIELRTPCQGTLDDLNLRHAAFLSRVGKDGFKPVPPLRVFDITGYRADGEPPRVSSALLALRKGDDSGYRVFGTARRSLHVAGMMRHAVSDMALLRGMGWTEDIARRLVLGHGEVKGDAHLAVEGPRLAFIPLPSIEVHRKNEPPVVGDIRRVLVTLRGELPPGVFERLTQRLRGIELIEEGTKEVAAVLQHQSMRDGAIRPYFASASTWATVTPVILPGYDDPKKLRLRLRENAERMTAAEKAEVLGKLDQRIDTLLRKALRQSGFSEVLVRHAHLEWRSVGYWPGTALASQYAVGDQHRRYRRLHVKIQWRDEDGKAKEISGPICIGGGKFTGMGLLAALSESPKGNK